jgi:hypothetical protein
VQIPGAGSFVTRAKAGMDARRGVRPG